jgi:hypothetical protein
MAAPQLETLHMAKTQHDELHNPKNAIVIETMQKELTDLGFYPGSVDGKPGPNTEAALRKFMDRVGLDEKASFAQIQIVLEHAHNAREFVRVATEDKQQALEQINSPNSTKTRDDYNPDFLNKEPSQMAASLVADEKKKAEAIAGHSLNFDKLELPKHVSPTHPDHAFEEKIRQAVEGITHHKIDGVAVEGSSPHHGTTGAKKSQILGG